MDVIEFACRLAVEHDKKLLGVDECEGELLIWLADGFKIAGHESTSFAVSEDDSAEYVKTQFDSIVPA